APGWWGPCRRRPRGSPRRHRGSRAPRRHEWPRGEREDAASAGPPHAANPAAARRQRTCRVRSGGENPPCASWERRSRDSPPRSRAGSLGPSTQMEDARRVLAEDRGPRGRIEIGLADDTERIGIPHPERMIPTEHDAIVADELNEVSQRLGPLDERVVEKAAE